MGIVYKLNFPDGKAYIGSTQQSLSRRLCQHKASANRELKTSVAKAIHRFGFESVVIEELVNLDHWLDLLNMEGKMIMDHGTMSPNGYNRLVPGCFYPYEQRKILTDKCRERRSCEI